MAAVDFYHLTHSTAAEALPVLLARTVEAGQRALVCCRGDHFKPLSTAIWSRQQDSWLPHGVRGRGRDEKDAGLCPIWITDDPADNPNGAAYHFFLDGIEPSAGGDAQRVFVLFEGRDGEATAAARAQWKALQDSDHELGYYQQDGTGKWGRKT